MARLMQQLAEAEGHCCVFMQFTEFTKRNYTNEQIADRLGVTERTVRNWKKKLKEGTLQCKELLVCQAGCIPYIIED